MSRYVCIHGHFYQPPRENPWLEEIEVQDAAYPYHDWNERITSECYAPNASSRILNTQGQIIDIVNNYSKISFNFGPTLLSWLQRCQPHLYKAILEADRISQKNFSGHGSAIAQAYNHMILPLANRRDKETQILWGIKDFEHRFQRKPEGMWLPETAVDYESLELLAQHGIKFTILSPLQSARVKKISEENWSDVAGGRIDSQVPYLCRLPSGKAITLFFYNGTISQEVAFAGLLHNGETFAKRLLGSFSTLDNSDAQLCHIATDGETYGHHHRFGDMALAYCLQYIESKQLANITIYGEFLEKFPAIQEVEILENTSWSCSHGVERWRADCGCRLGTHAGWDQKWREKLRQSLDWLRDQFIILFEQESARYLKNPWDVRNRYIDVILDRSDRNLDQFLKQFTLKYLAPSERVKIVKLLEIQRHCMLMFTSCGWFFDELSGIETIQVIQYAARAIQLAQDITGKDWEKDFVNHLKLAGSNLTELKDGARVYERFVAPCVINLSSVSVHYSVSLLFENYPAVASIYCYQVTCESLECRQKESKKLGLGRIKIKSSVTQEEYACSFAVLYQGDQNLNAGVKADMGDQVFKEMSKEVLSVFEKEGSSEVLRSMHKFFGTYQYSLWDIFKSEQENILNRMLSPTLEGIDRLFRQTYQHHYPLIHARKDKKISLPKALATTVEYILNRDLQRLFKNDQLDFVRIQKLIKEIRRWSFDLDKLTLSHVASQKVSQGMQRFLDTADDLSHLKTILATLKTFDKLPLPLNLWEAQNIYFRIHQKIHPKRIVEATQGDRISMDWIKNFEELGRYLQMNENKE